MSGHASPLLFTSTARWGYIYSSPKYSEIERGRRPRGCAQWFSSDGVKVISVPSEQRISEIPLSSVYWSLHDDSNHMTAACFAAKRGIFNPGRAIRLQQSAGGGRRENRWKSQAPAAARPVRAGSGRASWEYKQVTGGWVINTAFWRRCSSGFS